MRAVKQPAGVNVVAYRAIVTTEEPRLRVFSADLPASARHVEVPRAFLATRGEYKLEVQAIERSGNQTLTEVVSRQVRESDPGRVGRRRRAPIALRSAGR